MSQNTTVEFTEQDIVIELTDQGATGKTGNGISSIALISQNVLEKTYRISMTNETHFDFVVSDGNGIASIAKTATNVLTDTYTVSFTNGTSMTYDVINGKGIVSIEKTGTAGLVDTYTVSYNDNTSMTYTVTNGEKGDTGDAATISVGTTTTLPAGSSVTVTNSGDEHHAVFDFGIPKGDKGDKGNLMYATFEIDPDTGILSMFTDDEYNGPTFQLTGAYLEVVI